ncbi:twin-arginine translocation signal domain-containing protein [Dictyobacter vulcani]|nr:twin-arginine translocation signal domain-containing protein [Dictyobacter vulcani]
MKKVATDKNIEQLSRSMHISRRSLLQGGAAIGGCALLGIGAP